MSQQQQKLQRANIANAGVIPPVSTPSTPSPQIQHPDPTRIVIGLPLRDPHNISFLWSENLKKIQFQGPPGTQVLQSSRYGIAESREEIVNQALVLPPIPGISSGRVSHIFFLDSDIIPLTENVLNTLIADNLPIVSGIYWNSLHTGINAWVGHSPIPLQQPQNLLEVDDIGFGCCLIKREVFEKLRSENEPLPWFHYANSLNKQQSEDFIF